MCCSQYKAYNTPCKIQCCFFNKYYEFFEDSSKSVAVSRFPLRFCTKIHKFYLFAKHTIELCWFGSNISDVLLLNEYEQNQILWSWSRKFWQGLCVSIVLAYAHSDIRILFLFILCRQYLLVMIRGNLKRNFYPLWVSNSLLV